VERDREHLEDIISESILHENSYLDRFGSTIIIIAAVAPLLGLLGTVTGMISTFDIITEFGTGDPKLLSGGISEALVTTELGLVVAIPALIFGNLLAGWADNIKEDMEKAALRVTNIYKKNDAKA
jgi:biopolymer transport protein ExbB